MNLLGLEFIIFILLLKIFPGKCDTTVNETQIWQKIANNLSKFSSDHNIDIEGTDTSDAGNYITNWMKKIAAIAAANGDCLVTSDEDGIRHYPNLFTDMHGDKRIQGCELCEGGDGYPYKYVCKKGEWKKVMCGNSTFCTQVGRCQAECQPSIPNLLVNFDSYLKTAFQWSVYSTSLSFFFLRLSSYLACMHPWLFNRIVNDRNSIISVICSDILPLPVLFCLQFYVFNQGKKYFLIIEIIFAAILFFFEIIATLFAFIAYVRIHFKYKTLHTDKSDINALGAAVLQSICPNIILFVFFIYDLNNWYFRLYKEKVDARIDAAYGNYNTDEDHFFTFLKTFQIVMEFAKRYVTLIKPFVESLLILVLMPPFRNEILFHIRKIPCFKKDVVQDISQTSVNAIIIGNV